jgi:hypothetical protein
MQSFNSSFPNKKYIYFSRPIQSNDNNENGNGEQQGFSGPDSKTKKSNNSDLLKYFFPDILKALGNRAIKDSTPTLQELEQYLQNHLQELMAEDRNRKRTNERKENINKNYLNPLSEESAK